ncbi:hypothetical protein L2755_03770 [Shewanella abyssi]|uniref:hypothetical protein n=1 Tax=Shewanella abyssi TaxID=311789 RepID=UPI00200DD1DC|nr:hypothetical protein [Shewanella abyssi]MCL1048755.1 hypothetical protein [Shewanella abyssi]
MAKLFIFPLLLSLAWALFLNFNGVPLKQGKKGFIYIIGISLTIILALGFMLWLTAGQNIRSW